MHFVVGFLPISIRLFPKNIFTFHPSDFSKGCVTFAGNMGSHNKAQLLHQLAHAIEEAILRCEEEVKDIYA